MGAEQNSTLGRRRVGLKRAGVIVAIVLVAGLVVFAVSELNLHRVGHALITASPGWIVRAQTLINLLALGVLLAVTFSSVPLFRGHVSGFLAGLAIPLAIVLIVLAGPRLLSLAERSRLRRVSLAALAAGRLLHLARQGLAAFAQPRFGLAAVLAQFIAWALQWLACYSVILALGLEPRA